MRDIKDNNQKKEKNEVIKQISPYDICFIKNLKNDDPSIFYRNIFDLSTLNTIASYYSKDKKTFLLTFANKKRMIVFYDLNKEKEIKIIEKAHNSLITDLKRTYCEMKKIDLILTVSYLDNNLKVWESMNYSSLFSLENVYTDGYLYSAAFISENTKIHIATCNYCHNINIVGLIKIYNLEGKYIKEISDSKIKENVYYIETVNLAQYNYIVTSCKGYSKAYLFSDDSTEQIIKKFIDKEDKDNIFRMTFNHDNYEKYKICIGIKICISLNKIKFYNFIKEQLIKSIILDKYYFINILFLNYFYLVGLCDDKKIRFIDIKNEEVIDSLTSKKNKENFIIKKIVHPIYGECIISQEIYENELKLWGPKI